MNYLSVCSGVSAETLAWRPLGWRPAAFSQFDPDHNYARGPDIASTILANHYADVPNLGDMTKFEEWPDYARIDVLSGGTPCQSYSVAGLGEGLDDPRGDLALTYAAIARRYRPSWVVWENVGGVLSNDKGRAFGAILGLLSGQRIEVPAGGWRSAGVVPGLPRAYGLAWRVLDTQYVRVDGFGRALPQRRRRVFVVGYLGDWRRSAAVLFEREGLSGNPKPRRQAGQITAGTITRSFGVRGGVDEGERGTLIPDVAFPLTAHEGPHGRLEPTSETFIPEVGGTLTAGKNSTGGDRFPGMTADDAARNLIPIAFKPSHYTRGKDGAPSEVAFSLSADADKGDQDQVVLAPIAFDCKVGGATGFAIGDVPGPLRAGEKSGGGHAAICIPFDTTQITNPNNRINPQDGHPAYPLAASAHPPVIAYGLRSDASRDGEARKPSPDAQGRVRLRDTGFNVLEELAPTLDTGAAHTIVRAWSVRRLLPVECERLQGFPDGFTNVPWRGKNWTPDGLRYRVLGNAQSVNVMRWIGTRIQMVNDLKLED